MRNIHTKYCDDTSSKSGNWLLNDDEFTFWMKSCLSCGLWLQGHMGTGKSTLTMRVIVKLQEKYGTTQPGALAYYYCKGQGLSPDVKASSGILKALLRQLLETQSAWEVFQDWTNENPGAKPTALTTDNVKAIIKKIICRSQTPREETTIVIDGLDELSLDEQTRITDHVTDLMSTENGFLKVFIASRPLRTVEQRTQSSGWKYIALGSSSKSDMEVFVSNRIDEKWELDENDETQDSRKSLKEQVKTRAGDK